MKRILFFLIIPFFAVVSCTTSPGVEEPPAAPPPVQAAEPVPPPPEPQPAPPVEVVFVPQSISQEVRDATKSDIQQLVQELNQIIRAKNYNSWITYLSESYLAEISSPEFLADMKEQLFELDKKVAASLGRDPKKVQKKTMGSAKDYFTNVIVPSRTNDRVDDIEYVSPTQVKAYTVDNKNQRLVLYYLETIDNKWKITN